VKADLSGQTPKEKPENSYVCHSQMHRTRETFIAASR